jgi:hypothetical protein
MAASFVVQLSAQRFMELDIPRTAHHHDVHGRSAWCAQYVVLETRGRVHDLGVFKAPGMSLRPPITTPSKEV